VERQNFFGQLFLPIVGAISAFDRGVGIWTGADPSCRSLSTGDASPVGRMVSGIRESAGLL
jgi:hypothetical protein